MSPKLLKALNFAAIAHHGQKRADGITPYIVHPFAVGFILLKYGYSEDVVIVGILHDVIEDTKFSEIDIRKRFGKRISTMVLGVTENNKITSNKEKFKLYKYNLKKSDNNTKAICAADMLHNRQSILMELENKFDIWKALGTNKGRYLKKSYEKLTIIKEAINNELVQEVEINLKKIKAYN
ncbi:MAG: HD domain-containing protein [Patescibacteria group bacterium]